MLVSCPAPRGRAGWPAPCWCGPRRRRTGATPARPRSATPRHRTFRMRAPFARARWAPALLILTALSGCEKVQWGGAEVRVVQPPPPEGAAQSTPTPAEQTDLGLPRGTVVFHVVRSQGQDRIIPVAEVSGDSLRTVARPAGVSPQAYEQRFRQAVLPPA